MEVPDLSISTIWYLNDHISVVDQVKVSVSRQCRLNVEWSFNIETEVFIEFTLLWLLWILISIDDVPLLVNLSMLLVDHNILVFSIDSSLDIKDLVVVIDDESVLSSEELPPSGSNT
jgi:hypothetical protein